MRFSTGLTHICKLIARQRRSWKVNVPFIGRQDKLQIFYRRETSLNRGPGFKLENAIMLIALYYNDNWSSSFIKLLMFATFALNLSNFFHKWSFQKWSLKIHWLKFLMKIKYINVKFFLNIFYKIDLIERSKSIKNFTYLFFW